MTAPKGKAAAAAASVSAVALTVRELKAYYHGQPSDGDRRADCCSPQTTPNRSDFGCPPEKSGKGAYFDELGGSGGIQLQGTFGILWTTCSVAVQFAESTLFTVPGSACRVDAPSPRPLAHRAVAP
jgi:hypothetical protein